MKRFTFTILAILVLALSAGLVNAQTPEIDEKMAQHDALKEQMANATPEEYETLKAQYEALGAEIKTLIDAFNQADAESKSRAISLYNEGRQFFQQRNYTSAIASLEESSRLNPLEPKTFYMLGVAYPSNKQLEEAEQAFTKAIQLNGSYVKAYTAKGTILIRKRQFAEAVEVFQRGVQVTDGAAKDRSKAFGGLGLAYYYQKNYDRAVASYQQAVELDATNADAYYNMGKAYGGMGQFQEAANAVNQATELEPRKYKYHTAHAEYLNKIGSYSKAAAAAENAVAINANYAPAWFELGWAREHLGQKDPAIAAYEKAMNDRIYRQPAQYQIDILNEKF